MAIIREKVETGRNSDVTLAFLVDGQPIQHHSLTKVQFYIGPVLLDSTVQPELFDLSQADRMAIKMGQAGLPKGRYLARIYLYDTTNTLGKPWDDDVLLLDVLA